MVLYNIILCSQDFAIAKKDSFEIFIPYNNTDAGLGCSEPGMEFLIAYPLNYVLYLIYFTLFPDGVDATVIPYNMLHIIQCLMRSRM